MKKISALLLLMIALTGCYSRVDDIKSHASDVWAKSGFEVVGYEGYQAGFFATYGGCVWYVVSKEKTIYDGCISRWGDEYHIYNLQAKNAIQGK